MDWKKKCSEWGEKAKKLWADFLVLLGVAWEKTREFAGKAWIWMKKAWVWLKHHLKHLLGVLAVFALKARKWIRKTTARLRAWWSGWNGREWLAEKMGQLKAFIEKKFSKRNQPDQESLPEPEFEEEYEQEEAWEPEEEPVEELPSVQSQPAPRRRVPKEPETPLEKALLILKAIGRGVKLTCIWIYKLRRFIMAIPVIYFALKLAISNAARLPEVVGLNIQASGEFARMVSRNTAVMGPLAMTGFCLLLVFCSRKPLLPWMISIFTLIIPVLIWMTNYYA